MWMHSNKTPAETMAAHKAECNYIHFTNKRALKKQKNKILTNADSKLLRSVVDHRHKNLSRSLHTELK